MSNLRFTVGNSYTFMRVIFKKGEKGFFRSLYVPWEDELITIETMELICVEHHKVTDGWSKEVNCDGFVFKDKDGLIWDNQYPTATYGQLSDTNDRVVFLRMNEKDVFELGENGKIRHGEDGNPIVINKELWEKHNSTFWEHRFELCTVLLGNLYRSVNPRPKDHSNLSDNERKQLSEFLDKLIAKVEESNGKKVVFEPLTLNYTDGRPPKTSDYYIARIR